MTHMFKSTASGAVIAVIASIGMTNPSLAKKSEGVATHSMHMSRAHYQHASHGRMAAAPAQSTGNGAGNPFNDGDIFGGNGTVTPRATFGQGQSAGQYSAGYGNGGLLGGGGVLGTGVGGGNGVLGTGALNGQGVLGLGILGF